MRSWTTAAAMFVHSLMLIAPPRPPYAEFPPTTGFQTILVDRVHDGDTINGYFLVPAKFRLWGCNAPELGGEAGAGARDALGAMVPAGSRQVVELMGLDKYRRNLARFRTPDGGDVTLQLIGAGHAKPWDGQGAKP